MRSTRALVTAAAVLTLGPLGVGSAPAAPAAAAATPGAVARATGTTSTLTTVGRWNLDDRSSLASGTPDRDRIASAISSAPAGSFPGFPSDVSVKEGQPPVTSGTGHSFSFPGWHDRYTAACPGATGSSCSYVDPVASLATIPDPGNLLSPGTAPTTGPAGQVYWSVELDLRSDQLDVEVSDPSWDQPQGVGFGPASPNIAQQGKAAATGQWKVSQHPVRGSATTFTLSCDFIDGSTGEGRSATMASGVLTTGTDYHVVCALVRGGLPRLTVWHGSTQVVKVTGAYPETAYRVMPADDVFLGKKSGRADPTASSNTHANDAFAGQLDNVRIKSVR